MDPDLDCEIELEDFMCIDEEEDTNEPSTSGAESSHRNKDVESDKDKRNDRPSEAFDNSTSWRTTSRPYRGRWPSRGSPCFRSLKRSRDPLLMGRHPDFEAFLKRRNGKLEEMRIETTNRKEMRPESRANEPIGMKRDWRTEIGSTGSINEEVTLEEVDCCDSDEESVYDIIYEPNTIETVTADRSQSDDGGVLGSEPFKHERIGDLKTYDDPLWACDEDWPDLLGEVDEEAVRRAANQPIAIESNVALIVPQLSSNTQRHDTDRSSRGEDRVENRTPNDANVRNESKRNEDRSGIRDEKAKQITKAERVSSWRVRRRPSPYIHQHRRHHDDLGHPFESPNRREQHQIRPHFHKQIPSPSSTHLDQKCEPNIRKHHRYPLHVADRPLAHRSSHDNKGAETQWESGDSAKKISQKPAVEHAVNSPYPKTASPLPRMFSLSSSKGARNKTEALEHRRAISPPSSHIQKMPPYVVGSSNMTSRSVMFLENQTGTSRREDFRHTLDAAVARKHLMPGKSEEPVMSERKEHNGRCLPKFGRHITEAQVICPLVHSEQSRRQVGDVGKERSSDCRTTVKPKLNDTIKVSPTQKRNDDAARHLKLEESALHPSSKNSPLVSSTPSTDSTAHEKLPSLVATKDLEHKSAVRAVIFHKEADKRRILQSHLSVTVERHGDEARNVSHAFRNVSYASLQKTEIGNALAAPSATKINLLFTKKSPSKEEMRDASSSAVEYSRSIAQHSKMADERSVQAKKRRWTITNPTKATSSIADMTSSVLSNDDKQKTIIGHISQKDSKYAMMTPMNTLALSGGAAPRKIKLRLPSLSTA